MAQHNGLTVRQHQRASLNLRAEFEIEEGHREQVCFSSMSSAPRPSMAQGAAVDISPGGVGLVLPQFLPRNCRGEVRIYASHAQTRLDGLADDAAEPEEPIFRQPVRVRRVTLASHEPAYAVGAAFTAPGPDLEESVREVLDTYGVPIRSGSDEEADGA
jgi:hypothetical protein